MPSLSPNQLNHNEITDQENNTYTTEQNTQHLSRLQNEIGSKVLTLVNFESKNIKTLSNPLSIKLAIKKKNSQAKITNVETSPISPASVIWSKNMEML